jgi:hypothetical protein
VFECSNKNKAGNRPQAREMLGYARALAFAAGFTPFHAPTASTGPVSYQGISRPIQCVSPTASFSE